MPMPMATMPIAGRRNQRDEDRHAEAEQENRQADQRQGGHALS